MHPYVWSWQLSRHVASIVEMALLTLSGPSWFASVAPRKPTFAIVIRFTDGRCAVW